MACRSLTLCDQHFRAFHLLSIVHEQSLIICKLQCGRGDLSGGVELRLEGGPYQLRSGRLRFRYDVEGRVVMLLNCGLRRMGTY